MSKLITNTIRHTGGSADNITLDNSQNVTVEAKLTVANKDDANVNVLEVKNDNGNVSGGFTQASDGDGQIFSKKNDGTNTVLFRSDGNSHITGGNVGIGTTSPGGFKLKVEGGDSDEGLFIHTGNSSSQWLIRAEDNAANQRFVVKADGEVVIGDGNLKIGTSGHGIDFSATAGPTNGTGSSELFDDYEEGTWSPNYNADGAYVHGASTAHRYIKIGNQVTVSGNIRSNENTAGSSAFYITSLPFTSAAITNMVWVGTMGGDNGWSNTNTSFIALITDNSQHLRLHKNNTGVGMGDISLGGDVGTDANIYYSITYQAA